MIFRRIHSEPRRAGRFAAALLALCLAACAPTLATRGNFVDPDKLAEIKPGESTREDVANKIGSPTETGTFDEDVWYYLGQKTEQYSFFRPDIVEQQNLVIAFNEDGVVTSITKLDPELDRDISPVARTTPTYGHDRTLVDQLIGNLGKPRIPKTNQ